MIPTKTKDTEPKPKPKPDRRQVEPGVAAKDIDDTNLDDRLGDGLKIQVERKKYNNKDNKLSLFGIKSF